MNRIESVVGLCALASLTVAAPALAAPAEQQQAPAPASAAQTAAASPEATWGIKPVALRPTFGGRMLDFRYQVVDAVKARPLFDQRIKPYLFDPATRSALGSPEDTNVGALRASVRNPPVVGKQYYILFSNALEKVKKGSKVTVVIGDCKLENIVVE